MSTIKSSAEDLTLNADGSGNDIKFQSNGVEKASIDQDGLITSAALQTTGSVGVGTTASNYYSSADNLVVYDATDHAGMTIASGGTDKLGCIYFADGTSGTDEYEGSIEYHHSTNTMMIGTNHATSMSIDSTGAVTMPNQPAFLVKPSSTQSNIAINTSTQIAFGTEIFDQGANFASNVFTAPVTGRYQFNISLYITGFDVSASYYAMYIQTSNRSYELINSGSVSGTSDPTYNGFGWSCLADMDASDTAQITLYQSGGGAQTDITAGSLFSGFLAC